MIKHAFLSLLLLAATMTVSAQTAAPATQSPTPQPTVKLTPEQVEQLKTQNTNMVRAALQTAQLIDQGKAGLVWDAASGIARQAATREAFVNQIARDRNTLGQLQSRQNVAVTRLRANGEALPAGYYINVVFASRFANGGQPVRELVSFHLDNDKVWRVTGYTLR